MLQILLPFIIYILPSLFLFYMAVDIYQRNPKRTEHRLAGLISFSMMMLFIIEYVRNLLPIAYSSLMITFWFANFGALAASLGMHFHLNITGFDKRWPKWWVIGFSYSPMLPVVLTLLLQKNIMNSSAYMQIGIWKYPVYNFSYYISISAGVLEHLIFIVLLAWAFSRGPSNQEREKYTLLTTGVFFSLLWHVVFGILIPFSGPSPYFPPYTYIFGDIIWMTYIRLTMLKFHFLAPVGKKYEIVYEMAPTGIMLVSASGRIIEANPEAHLLFGYFGEPLAGHSLYDLFWDEKQNEQRERHQSRFREGKKWVHVEMLMRNRQGQRMVTLVEGDKLDVEGQDLNLLIFHDVTERKKAEQQVAYLAYHDGLTELPNRVLFYRTIQELIREAQQQRSKLAVILIDLDNLKVLNDTLGHQAGDLMLRRVAGILKEATLEMGIAARFGGDEFVLCLTSVNETKPVLQMIDNILAKFQTPYLFEGRECTISASVGISFFPEHGEDIDRLIQCADAAMYEAKRKGKNHYRIYQFSKGAAEYVDL